MLKLNYTESGFHLERISAPVERLVQERVLLALRLGSTLHLEPSTAAFLLALDGATLKEFERILHAAPSQPVSLILADEELVEVSVEGTWVAASADAEVGTFYTALSEDVEAFLFELWERDRSKVSSLA